MSKENYTLNPTFGSIIKNWSVLWTNLCEKKSSNLFNLWNWDKINNDRLLIDCIRSLCVQTNFKPNFNHEYQTSNDFILFNCCFRATCVYLACKTEEFNVSIGQFVSNIRGDRAKAMDIILSNELLLMQRLNYYLTIHNPYRPVEGFLIDIKTRCSLVNPDRLRNGIDEFLEKTFFTEACLLFAPSQIALAAVLHAASKEQENLDSYVIECLFHNTRDKLKVLISAVQKIRLMVKNAAIPDKEDFKRIERKLEKCRNQENNPDSEALVLVLTISNIILFHWNYHSKYNLGTKFEWRKWLKMKMIYWILILQPTSPWLASVERTLDVHSQIWIRPVQEHLKHIHDRFNERTVKLNETFFNFSYEWKHI